MKLFRISVVGNITHAYKRKTLYVVEETKEKAKLYVEKHLKRGWTITSSAYLGDDMTFGHRMFCKE